MGIQSAFQSQTENIAKLVNCFMLFLL